MVSMKKLIFVFVFALLGTYFQSAQAQTFSRVVTVNIDTFFNGISSQNRVIYKVPPNKVFKLSYIGKDITYIYGTSNNKGYPTDPISINSFSLPDNIFFGNLKEQEGLWLKSGDEIRYKTISQYPPSSWTIKIFLSGIEYDVQ
jgi:hypothetical protein